jgi:hypothetical protein
MTCISRYFYIPHLAKDSNVEQVVDGVMMKNCNI